ncbi:hypothetical protein EW146_g7545 [Bondarzewia mesenterica]|uniref:Phospholipase/carboxylesterase/thioesterase domain-containing protein n=1 Tax=Bondarzewia mesenterica TaxID=1095465 RepID=A0A4V3XE74_9AGAM|nr:hypothetical protein EW146_g7545 [Bondarzewia mesenterica]
MDVPSDIHVRESISSSDGNPSVKPAPKSPAMPVPFTYAPSPDGTDENLLIFLHGLGDTHVPFSSLARSLNLPQTATLSLRAPEQIPYLYEDAYQWYPSFTPLGELDPHPNPTPALTLLSKILSHLTRDCHWPMHRIHMFGFAQGGSVAVEFTLKLWRDSVPSSPPNNLDGTLGSVVSISGPLLSYPTLTSLSPTPLLYFHRTLPSTSFDIAAFRKGFAVVSEVKIPGQGDAMPKSRTEWEPIMRFWSERLGRRVRGGGLYEVTNETASV